MVTVRTIKLKRSSQAYGDAGNSSNLAAPSTPETIPQAEPSSPSPAAPDTAAMSEALENMPEAAPVAVQAVSGKYTIWFMLGALIAVFGLLILLGLQNSEMSFYKSDPSVWLPGK